MEIAGYQDLEEIGRGGYAVVYKAHQAAFGRTVAIKVLTNPGFGPTDRARFQREALAMGRLSWHPNIVIVHDTGETATGMPYLIEEFLEGGSLGDKLRRTGPFGPAEALSDMIQLCAAVHTAHEADLLHRDIKPDNALVDAFGKVKLADFGIAAVTGSTLTATGVVTATIAHAAPEVLNGARATFQADVYSLGSTLYELLTGAPAFVRETDESIVPLVVRVSSQPVPDVRAQGVPEPAAEAVEWAMAKEPGDRPETALALGRQLQMAQQVLGYKVTDLSVRGGSKSKHDDTIVGGKVVPPPVVAVTPPPPPAPAPVPPPPAPAPVPTTSETPAAAELASDTGTVAVPPVVAPPPGSDQAPRFPTPPTTEKRSKGPLVLAALVVLAVIIGGFLIFGGGDDGGGDGSEDFGEVAGTTPEGSDPDGSEPTTGPSPPSRRPSRPATARSGSPSVTGPSGPRTTTRRPSPASISRPTRPSGTSTSEASRWGSTPTPPASGCRTSTTAPCR